MRYTTPSYNKRIICEGHRARKNNRLRNASGWEGNSGGLTPAEYMKKFKPEKAAKQQLVYLVRI